MRSISQAEGALKQLTKLLPNTATRVDGDQLKDVPLSELRDGDVVPAHNSGLRTPQAARTR
jgi:Cu2+-exporting ATPase